MASATNRAMVCGSIRAESPHRGVSVRRQLQHCSAKLSQTQAGIAGNSGTSSRATILMILMSGLMAGPAVSL